MNEHDIREMAKQLRKPEGEKGIEVGEMMNDGNKPMNLHSLAVLDPQANDSILELGMGNGFFINNIVGIDSSIRYTGCDFSALMVEEAAKNNGSLIEQGQVQIIQGSGENLPFDNNSFNKILTINTLYFWTDINKTFSELKRVLTPGGELIIAVRPKHNLEKFPVTEYGFTMYTKDDLIELYKQSGFVNLEITEIKEPPHKIWEEKYERETLIVSGKLD